MMEQQDVADAISLDRLLPKERSVLHHIWSRFAGQRFDDDKLRSLRVRRLSGVEVQLAFLSLRQQRWVQAVKQGWGERMYFIPLISFRFSRRPLAISRRVPFPQLP